MLVSIFNDVIGPVMRGPSSSHCAAALRIGRLARDLMGGAIEEAIVTLDRHGALATTHESQGSDMGLFGGLMGWSADDARLPESPRLIREAGVRVRIDIADLHDSHPNTYHLTLRNANGRHEATAVSTGGGMIEVTRLDGFSVSLRGDYRETLFYLDGDGETLAARVAESCEVDAVHVHTSETGQLVQVQARRFVDDAIVRELQSIVALREVRRLDAVLPILSRKDIRAPFKTYGEMLCDWTASRDPLWKLAVRYESARGGLAEDDVVSMMLEIVRIVRRSIEEGIQGVQFEDRILGRQCGVFRSHMNSGRLLSAGVLNRIVLYVTALMEAKSSMGVIVAAPTAGACAALPGACVAAAEEMGAGDEAIARAMLAGGVIGVLIAGRSTFAAEVCGCQAECGAASCMAAAALATLADGTTPQALAAASMALQSVLGLICDPVAGRVEVPCLGKNVLAASNALACANMALADFDPVIPLDEVIEAADRVGRRLPRELRCTALGGLSTTAAARKVEKRLAKRKARAS